MGQKRGPYKHKIDKTELLKLKAKSIKALKQDLEDPDRRGAAARYILDQLMGRPVMPVESKHKFDGPLQAVIVEGPKPPTPPDDE